MQQKYKIPAIVKAKRKLIKLLFTKSLNVNTKKPVIAVLTNGNNNNFNIVLVAK